MTPRRYRGVPLQSDAKRIPDPALERLRILGNLSNPRKADDTRRVDYRPRGRLGEGPDPRSPRGVLSELFDQRPIGVPEQRPSWGVSTPRPEQKPPSMVSTPRPSNLFGGMLNNLLEPGFSDKPTPSPSPPTGPQNEPQFGLWRPPQHPFQLGFWNSSYPSSQGGNPMQRYISMFSRPPSPEPSSMGVFAKMYPTWSS